jgi:hypothetical protein
LSESLFVVLQLLDEVGFDFQVGSSRI